MTSYHDELKALAESIGSDGCTHALQIDVECCWEHDYTYVTGKTPRGILKTKEQADQRFRDCIQSKSFLRKLSPMSAWRWIAVSLFGEGIWSKKELPQGLYVDSTLEEAREARAQIVADVLSEQGAKK